MSSIHRAIAHLGSQQKLAAILGVVQQTISHRLRTGKELSLDDLVKIEAATAGLLAREMLRPEVFPPAPAAGALQAGA